MSFIRDDQSHTLFTASEGRSPRRRHARCILCISKLLQRLGNLGAVARLVVDRRQLRADRYVDKAASTISGMTPIRPIIVATVGRKSCLCHASVPDTACKLAVELSHSPSGLPPFLVNTKPPGRPLRAVASAVGRQPAVTTEPRAACRSGSRGSTDTRHQIDVAPARFRNFDLLVAVSRMYRMADA